MSIISVKSYQSLTLSIISSILHILIIAYQTMTLSLKNASLQPTNFINFFRVMLYIRNFQVLSLGT